jgi:chromosome segregation ATPase
MAAFKKSAEDNAREKLEAARARLAEARERLAPLIAAAAEKQRKIEQEKERTQKASTRARERLANARAEARERLGFTPEGTKVLHDQLRDYFNAAGLTRVSVPTYAERVIYGLVDGEPDVIEARGALAEAEKVASAAFRTWNVMTNTGGEKWELEKELSLLQGAVDHLEKQLERAPVRRDAARNRRQEEREEELAGRENLLAAELVKQFTWRKS